MRAGNSAPTPLLPPSGGLATGSAAAKIDAVPLSFQFELLEHRMPLAEQIDAPPGVFLRDILGGNNRPHHPGCSPARSAPGRNGENHLSQISVRRIFLQSHQQRMDMVAIPPRILFQRVEIRNAPHLRAHEFFRNTVARTRWMLPTRNVMCEMTCHGARP